MTYLTNSRRNSRITSDTDLNPPASSKWELRVRAALEDAGLGGLYDQHTPSFVRSNGQQNFTHPDITYPDLGVLLYLDGCYWHGCPYHHPTRRKANDERTNRALQLRGLIVVREWECTPIQTIVARMRSVVMNTGQGGQA